MNLWQQYELLKKEKGRLYFPREGASDLGVSEGQLMASAPKSVYLGGNVSDIVRRLHELGTVECIVRNSLVVHEKTGEYKNVSLGQQAGIALNIGGIDLRLFPHRWYHALAVETESHGKLSRSIQIYDEYGVAIQKIFIRDENCQDAWEKLIQDFRSVQVAQFVSAELPPVVVPNPLAKAQESAFQESWLGLKDIHHFGDILNQFNLDRQASYRYAPKGMAVLADNFIWERVLNYFRDNGMEAMIFVGNRGIVQIQTGKMHHVVRAHGYLNILDSQEEGFNLHLNDTDIAESWIIRRPVKDGMITSIEGFDTRRKVVIQIFARRINSPDQPQSWRQFTDQLMQDYS